MSAGTAPAWAHLPATPHTERRPRPRLDQYRSRAAVRTRHAPARLGEEPARVKWDRSDNAGSSPASGGTSLACSPMPGSSSCAGSCAGLPAPRGALGHADQLAELVVGMSACGRITSRSARGPAAPPRTYSTPGPPDASHPTPESVRRPQPRTAAPGWTGRTSRRPGRSCLSPRTARSPSPAGRPRRR